MDSATSNLGTVELLRRPPPEWPATFRFSTDDVPESDRLPFFREFLGRQVMRQDIDPLPDHPFRADTTMRRLPGLLMYWTTGSARRVRRTRELLTDGNDSLLFQWVSVPRQVEHLGREILVGPGEGIVFSCADTRSVVQLRDYRTVSLTVPRSALGLRLSDVNATLGRPLHRKSAAQHLLLRYLEVLREESAAATTQLSELAIDHVCDLLAVAIGATRDAADVAKTRGVRAARLLEIKNSVRQNLSQVTLAGITTRHRLTPRYVQMLFEYESTTFTEFVLEERLALARRLLASPRSTGRKIADIAFDCGFGDISYFNRKFRARFGATPSDLRNSRHRGADVT
ncbi:MAG TPA: helix-turn-helix domain-containing protein [Rhizomicrobium sp.]|jgi:AraC-like DNA-binding protein|nr:helix-turn-helix domain-containing protein [Rhizomicrobium sp.]